MEVITQGGRELSTLKYTRSATMVDIMDGEILPDITNFLKTNISDDDLGEQCSQVIEYTSPNGSHGSDTFSEEIFEQELMEADELDLEVQEDGDECEDDAGYESGQSGSSTGSSQKENGGKTGKPRMREWLKIQLDNRKYSGLVYQDSSNGIFQVPWKHAATTSWNEEDCRLYKAWAEYKGKCRKETNSTTWKATFRCALNTLDGVQELKSLSKKKGLKNPYKVYQFVEEKKGKNKKIKSTKATLKKLGKEEREEAIRSNANMVSPKVEVKEEPVAYQPPAQLPSLAARQPPTTMYHALPHTGVIGDASMYEPVSPAAASSPPPAHSGESTLASAPTVPHTSGGYVHVTHVTQLQYVVYPTASPPVDGAQILVPGAVDTSTSEQPQRQQPLEVPLPVLKANAQAATSHISTVSDHSYPVPTTVVSMADTTTATAAAAQAAQQQQCWSVDQLQPSINYYLQPEREEVIASSTPPPPVATSEAYLEDAQARPSSPEEGEQPVYTTLTNCTA